MTISFALTTQVSLHPYLHNDFDKEAVIVGIKNIQDALSNVQNLTWIQPPPNSTVEDFVNKVT